MYDAALAGEEGLLYDAVVPHAACGDVTITCWITIPRPTVRMKVRGLAPKTENRATRRMRSGRKPKISSIARMARRPVEPGRPRSQPSRAATPLRLQKIAWHIGNRHLAAQIGETRILIRRDHVIADMLRGLGARVRNVVEPFDPEGGAYGGAHHGHHHD